jgi:4-hydroxy-3-polyprenylbenzoate decarboxylase
MAFKDLREYLADLEKYNELVRIKEEIDWDCEAGAFFRRGHEREAQAILLENVRDYPEKRLMGGILSTLRRFAIAMQLDPDIPTQEMFKEFDRRRQNPIKPVLIDSAPAYEENLLVGDQVDLSVLPSPMVHDGDGGRYNGTWHMLVTKDPDTNWTNWGMYRQMIHNNKHMGALMLPNGDAGKQKAKWMERGEPMPFASVIGCEPITNAVACMPYGVQMDEVDMAGGIRNAPVELVKCKTVPLEVPASAEIVIEGHILHDTEVDEGPFGEYTGYRSGPRGPRSICRVSAIAFRNNPILTVANMGVPVDDCDICYGAVGTRGLFEQMLRADGLKITGVSVPPQMVGHVVIVGVKKNINHIATQIGNRIFSHPSGMWQHIVIVVDEDVDVHNLNEVFHAFAAKLHPLKSIIQYPAWGHMLAPYLSLEERTFGKGGRVIIDLTAPLEWDKENELPPKVSFNNIYSKETQEQVLSKWAKFGLK